jgi:hypothetical protein
MRLTLLHTRVRVEERLLLDELERRGGGGGGGGAPACTPMRRCST